MRQVLVDYARARSAQKRSSDGSPEIPWSPVFKVNGEKGSELLELIALDSALKVLAEEDENLAQLHRDALLRRVDGGKKPLRCSACLYMSFGTISGTLRHGSGGDLRGKRC